MFGVLGVFLFGVLGVFLFGVLGVFSRSPLAVLNLELTREFLREFFCPYLTDNFRELSKLSLGYF